MLSRLLRRLFSLEPRFAPPLHISKELLASPPPGYRWCLNLDGTWTLVEIPKCDPAAPKFRRRANYSTRKRATA